MKPFWIVYNPCWVPDAYIHYSTKEAAIKEALNMKNSTKLEFFVMQPVGITAPPPVDVELNKEEYSATPNEMRERETKEGEEKEISPPEETKLKG